MDVLIVGAGIMGSGVAWQLTRRGIRARVLEKSIPGAEASSAAAGIIGAQMEAQGPGGFFDLALASRALFEPWSEALRLETGIDIEFRPTGLVQAARSAAELHALRDKVAWQETEGLPHDWLSARELRRMEPAIGDVEGGVLFPQDGRVDPRRLFSAVRIAAEKAGAEFLSGMTVQSLLESDGAVTGIRLDDGKELHADAVVLAAGSWSSLVSSHVDVRPVRGQVIELHTQTPILQRVVYGDGVYLVPRDDGRLLVGATTEHVGFERAVTAGALSSLMAKALELVPGLSRATFERAWCNFRPLSASGDPIIGATNTPGLYVATGHYRNGILLAPITAERVAEAISKGEGPRVRF